MRNWTLLIVSTTLVLLTLGGTGQAAEEQRVTITMDDFSYTPARIVLEAGVPVVVKLVNEGKIEHEFMAYTLPPASVSHIHEWAHSNTFFKGTTVSVDGGRVERHDGHLVEIWVAAGGSADLRFTPRRTGQFEIGCHLPGHYEAGMKAVLLVEEPDS